MKKFLSGFSLALCLLFGAVFFTACGGGSDWAKPNFDIQNDDYEIVFTTNEEEDFVFPIEGIEKLDHAQYLNDRFQYTWLIKNTSNNEMIGWIETGSGYEGTVKDGFKYGYSTSTNNGVYEFNGSSITIYLKTTDLSVFENMELTADVGVLEKWIPASGFETNPYSASQFHNHYDETIWNPATERYGDNVPNQGANDFVCYKYFIDMSGVNPKTTKDVNFSLNLPNLHI